MKFEKLFNPESVAVIGASRKEEKVGHSVLESLKNFKGKIYPVNPKAEEIMGLKSYPSLSDIEAKVDLGIITLPQKIANESLKECRDEDVENVIMIGSGYSEVGNQEAEEELKEIIKGSTTRVLGPNCLGIYDPHSGLDTMFVPEEKFTRPPRGNISIVTQSGGVGFSIMNELGKVSKYVSYGNQVDISETEIMEALKDDENTKVIASYVEGLKDGSEFLRKLPAITKEKPVVMLKAGKSKTGKGAVSSHTGSMAGSEKVYSGALRQAGVMEAKSVNEMIDYLKALSYSKPLKAGKIAMVTNCGGMGVIEADLLSQEENSFDKLLPEGYKENLRLVEFDKGTSQELEKYLLPHSSTNNPIDLGGDATAEDYKNALEVLGNQDYIDGIIAIGTLHPVSINGENLVKVFKNFNQGYEKPFITSLGVEIEGETEVSDYSKPTSQISLLESKLEEAGIPVYRTPERIANGIEALFEYGRWRKIQDK